MKPAFYEIWMHKEQRIWKVYSDVTEEVRIELNRNGWTYVLRNERVEAVAGPAAAPKKPRGKKGSCGAGAAG